MKKNSIYAFMSAIALTGAVGFSSCSSSSSDEVVNNPDYIPESNAVKTQFTISIPSNVNAPKTRMSATSVQQTDNSFRGMQDIVLIPFTAQPTAATDVSAGDPISLASIAAGGVTALSGNNHYKVYPNVTVPLGTSAFLFYAQADKSTGTNFVNGYTEKGNPTTAGTAGYLFTPVAIYNGATNTVGEAIATYLTSIATATGWNTSTGGLKTLYDQFILLEAGSSAAIQRSVSDLYTSLTGTDAVTTAIKTAILTKATVSEDPEPLTFDASINGYPANLNLPDGAAAVKWDDTNKKFDVDDTGTTVATLESYVYPAALWYTANTNIKVSSSKQADANGVYPTGRNTWDETAETGILNLYDTGTGTVTPTTRSVALIDKVQYAVGRLDVTIKCEAATLYDYAGTAVNMNEAGFPVSAVLIGGQKPVDFTFSTPTGTTTYTIYDKDVTGVNAKTTAEGTNYTLALETAANADVNIAIELTNNTGADFHGKNGQLIPKGGKFYLTATLAALSATTTANKIFKQDYYTIANLTIKTGTLGTTNNVGLGTATNTIPDLRVPALELGMAVDLHWQAGNTYNIDI